MTLIASGVQILPDRWFFTEAFGWDNSKKTLLNLIKKNRKSGVILLSGDVHFAQFYTTQCSSLSGGYAIPELTSSGLTHHVNSFFKIADRVLDLVTPTFWTSRDIYMGFNFGYIEVKKDTQGEVNVKIQVRDIGGGVRLEKEFEVGKGLRYREQGNKHSKMCYTVHA